MRKKLAIICLLASFSIVGCKQQEIPAEQEESSSENAAAVQVGTITAGTERSETGEIKNARTTFHPSDRPLFFNVEVMNVTEETTVNAGWIIEGDGGPFTSYSLTATPTEMFAKFDLEKDTDWPAGTYTMLVFVGKDRKAFQYKVE